jgi:hypothetical protein
MTDTEKIKRKLDEIEARAKNDAIGQVTAEKLISALRIALEHRRIARETLRELYVRYMNKQLDLPSEIVALICNGVPGNECDIAEALEGKP